MTAAQLGTAVTALTNAGYLNIRIIELTVGEFALEVSQPFPTNVQGLLAITVAQSFATSEGIAGYVEKITFA